LEVKGGRIAREDGVWIYTDRFGASHRRVESPFDQASSAMFSIEQAIRLHFREDSVSRVLFGYGVIFPDVSFDAVGCEGDPAQVYDARDRHRSFTAYVERLARFTRNRQPTPRVEPTVEQIGRLTSFLRGDFDLSPSLETTLEDTRAQLDRL